MSKFKSINYSRVVCEGCGQETTIEPGIEFGGMNCKCKDEPPKGLAEEISTPVLEELDYVKNQTVTVIGRFENGDYEVINSNDATDSWRVPKDTFESTYEVVKVLTDADALADLNGDPRPDNPSDEAIKLQEEGTTTEDNQEPDTSEESDSSKVTLSLEDLKGKTSEEIKDGYNMDELRTLAKEVKIKGYSNMRETKLVTRLLEAATKAE